MLIQKEEEIEKLKGRSPALRKSGSFDLGSTFDSASKKEMVTKTENGKEGLN